MTEAPPLTPGAFQSETGISPEAMARLGAYADLLVAWQKKINLVGGSTLPDLWRRHMLDSAQLLPHLPAAAGPLLDVGSGAGFPALVLAICGVPDVHLVESDGRKAAFLTEAARITGTVIHIHRCRIEKLTPFPAKIVTARACAPLAKLIEYVEPFLTPDTICMFPKGRNAEEELTDSQKNWMMKATRIRSLTDSAAQILRIEDISRRHGS